MATDKKHLYLVSEVDIPTGKDPERPGVPKPMKRVGPGILADLDITDAEIKSLPRGVIRNATVDEVEGAAGRAKADEARRVAAEAADEQRAAEAEHDAEKAAIASKYDAEKNAELAKIDTRREAERVKEATAAAADINKAAGVPAAKTPAKR